MVGLVREYWGTKTPKLLESTLLGAPVRSSVRVLEYCNSEEWRTGATRFGRLKKLWCALRLDWLVPSQPPFALLKADPIDRVLPTLIPALQVCTVSLLPLPQQLALIRHFVSKKKTVPG